MSATLRASNADLFISNFTHIFSTDRLLTQRIISSQNLDSHRLPRSFELYQFSNYLLGMKWALHIAPEMPSNASC